MNEFYGLVIIDYYCALYRSYCCCCIMYNILIAVTTGNRWSSPYYLTSCSAPAMLFVALPFNFHPPPRVGSVGSREDAGGLMVYGPPSRHCLKRPYSRLLLTWSLPMDIYYKPPCFLQTRMDYIGVGKLFLKQEILLIWFNWRGIIKTYCSISLSDRQLKYQ